MLMPACAPPQSPTQPVSTGATFGKICATIFVIEALATVVLQLFFPLEDPSWSYALNAILLTMFSAPIIHLWIIRRMNHSLMEMSSSLSTARSRAESADRMKAQFLDLVDQELQAPLNGIVGFSTLLRSGLAADDSQVTNEWLGTIHSCGTRLTGVISAMTNFVRLEDSSFMTPRSEILTMPLILQPIEGKRAQARQKDLDLYVDWPTELPHVIHTNAACITHILESLIDNAIKFTDCGWIKVVVSAAREHDRCMVKIAVIDNGIGMTPEHLSKLFAPFYQAEATCDYRRGGIGMGLATSQRLARALGGEILVTSKLGCGSEFTFVLDVGPAAILD